MQPHQRTPQQHPLPPPPEIQLHPGDCTQILPSLQAESVHLVLTDPPYFLDGLDAHWKKGRPKKATGTIGGLPIGMKFDRRQSQSLQRFIEPVAAELLRILKPGGFAPIFSAPRLYHRMAVAVENAGFEIRDQYVWHYTRKAQFKAFSMDHFVRKNPKYSASEKQAVLTELAGRKTPQLRPQFESILCAQKPRHGTFVENWLEHGTGLIDAAQTLSGQAPATVMAAEKDPKDKYNCHLTPKPLRLCEHLIRLFTRPQQWVLDPFLGSGTTCLAAQQADRHSIGIEINPDYLQIAEKRLAAETCQLPI